MIKLSRIWKIVVGFGTFLTVIYPFLFMFVWFLPFFFLPDFSSSQPPELETWAPEAGRTFIGFFFLFFFVMMIFAFVQFAMMIFYIVHILKNKIAAETLHLILGVGIYLLPFFAWPAYYLIYILPETPPDWALADKPRGRKRK